MDIRVLDSNLVAIDTVDMYKSLVWTDRYDSIGDFEIYTPISYDVWYALKQNRYLQILGSDHTMIIESRLVKPDIEDGDFLVITGRSLESILTRRIIWGLKTVTGDLQTAIKSLLDDCIINPADINRKIDNFIFVFSTDPAITSLTIEAQYTGDNLYEVIQSVCSERNLGFKITLNNSNQFVFELYSGADRSYAQVLNSYVIFSPNFENLMNSSYLESTKDLKNVTLIAGEGEGIDRKYTYVGSESGINRRELFTDARDISSNAENETTLTNEEYTALLQQRGSEKLSENTEIVSFEGAIENTTMFVYGRDFFVGDIVQIADEYGHETESRITELVISQDENGASAYPTFKNIL